jgi:hypothetical protein
MRYPHQEQNYRDNPAMKDYEDMLGHSPLNFTNYEDFLRATDKAAGSGKREAGAAAAVKGQAAEGGAEDAKAAPGTEELRGPRPRKKHATKRQVQERLASLANMLLENVPVARVYRLAQDYWGIGRRMTQLYLQRIRKKMAAEASKADYLAHLWLSKLQKDQLIYRAIDKLDQCEAPRDFANVLRACHQLMKDRDGLMASVLAHRAATQRDHSPDGAAATARRGKMMEMPFDELFERLEHLRNLWWWEWNQERMKAEAEKKLRTGQGQAPGAADTGGIGPAANVGPVGTG